MTRWIEADDFTLPTIARIENVKFWNFEGSGSFEGSIMWQIYADADSNTIGAGPHTPGTLLFSGTSTNVTHVATGFVYFGYAEFITTFDITPVSLPAGIYWLALHNGPLTNDTDLGRVYWETTSNINVRPSHALITPFNGPWFSNAIPPSAPSDCAFQVNGVPGPLVTQFAFNNGNPSISFTTTSDHDYRVEYKESLTDMSWTPVLGAGMISGTGMVVQVTDSDPSNTGRRFYSVTLL